MASEFIPESTTDVKVVPKDLQDKWAAVIACSTCHKLLQDGHFTYKHRNSVGLSLAFLEEIYKNAFADCSAHPQAHMIDELKDLMKKADENGEIKETN